MCKTILFFSILFFTFSCTDEPLPFLGVKTLDMEGNELEHSVSAFSFTNQENQTITEEHLKNKITVVNFFFTSCPTICPVMTKNMKAIQEKWINEESIQFLSHTVDPETDTPHKMKRFAKFHNLDLSNWNFLTGKKEELYEQGFYSYMVSANVDVLAPGGFLHSSLFILVDKNLHVRGVYDGTNKEEISKLNLDLKTLMNE